MSIENPRHDEPPKRDYIVWEDGARLIRGYTEPWIQFANFAYKRVDAKDVQPVPTYEEWVRAKFTPDKAEKIIRESDPVIVQRLNGIVREVNEEILPALTNENRTLAQNLLVTVENLYRG